MAVAQLWGLRNPLPASRKDVWGRLGNPYDAIGADRSGRVSIDWGVYGVPETYVIDGKGQIVYKLVGPLSNASFRSKLLPAIEAARKAAAKTSN